MTSTNSVFSLTLFHHTLILPVI